VGPVGAFVRDAMVLAVGLTFRVAPRFHCRTAWAERLCLNGGMVCQPAGVFPRDDWRPASADELRVLVAAESDTTPELGDDQIALLALPAHLRTRWWELAEQSDMEGGTVAGFAALADALVELLRFKRLPLPARCAAAVVVSRPGQPSIRLDATGSGLSGLGFNSPASARGRDGHAVPIAVINLGDEAAQIVMLNLAVHALGAYLADEGVQVRARDVDVLRAFATRHPDYPLIGVRLDPGEGLWLPTPPPAFDGWTVGKHDVDTILVLHGDRRVPANRIVSART
jgi:hypothetical protein